MATEVRIVIDTNVVVSAMLFPGSTPSRALRKARQHSIVVSEAISIELLEVMRRPKWDRYLQQKRREEVLAAFLAGCTPVPVFTTIRACRDPRDDKFLELAVDGRANLILTGDQDLLALHPFRGISIFTPSQYLESSPA